MGTVKRPRVILGIDWQNFGVATVKSRNICTKMTVSASTFTACNPSMAIYGQQCTDFEQAHHDVVTTKAKGAATLRENKRNIVRTSAESERAYVQFLCDTAPPGEAATLATLAGMEIWTPGTHNREVIHGALTHNKGEVALEAASSLLLGASNKKSANRFFMWRHFLAGTTTYVSDEPTAVAKTVVTGLPLNTYVSFEVAVKDAAGVGPWSQAWTIYVF